MHGKFSENQYKNGMVVEVSEVSVESLFLLGYSSVNGNLWKLRASYVMYSSLYMHLEQKPVYILEVYRCV